MFGTGKGFLGGLIGLLIFSVVVFFVIYLLVPEVSLKFFGIAVNSERYVEQSMEKSIESAELPEGIAGEIIGFLSSQEGREMVATAQDKAGATAEGLISFFGSDGFHSIVDRVGDYVAAGAGSAADFFRENPFSIPGSAE